MGAWWSQSQDGVQAHRETQALSMTMFNRKCLSQTLHSPLELGQQQFGQHGSWETQNRGLIGAREVATVLGVK